MATKRKAKKNTLFGQPRGDVIKHPGAEREAAKKAGMSTHAYMEKHKRDAGKAGKRARLGLALSRMSKHRKKSTAKKTRRSARR